jgi:hypothetical protein
VTLKRGHNIKHLPYAFTEHGAITAANVLNSPRGVQMSVFVVRAFVKLRAVFADIRQTSNSERRRRFFSRRSCLVLSGQNRRPRKLLTSAATCPTGHFQRRKPNALGFRVPTRIRPWRSRLPMNQGVALDPSGTQRATSPGSAELRLCPFRLPVNHHRAARLWR